MAVRHDGPVPPAVRDILKEELALHGFDIQCRQGQVLVIHHNFLVRIKFPDENMLVSLDLTAKKPGIMSLDSRTFPLADPNCFRELAALILGWFRS